MTNDILENIEGGSGSLRLGSVRIAIVTRAPISDRITAVCTGEGERQSFARNGRGEKKPAAMPQSKLDWKQRWG